MLQQRTSGGYGYQRNIEYQRRVMVLDKPTENYNVADTFAIGNRYSRTWTNDENGKLPFPKQFLYKVYQGADEVPMYDMLIILAKYEKPVTLMVRDKNSGELRDFDVVLYLDEFTSEVCASDIDDKWAVSLPRMNMML